MFPASCLGGGQCLGNPDVCKTPAPPAPFVPVPYPNIAMLAQANPGTCSMKVLVNGQPSFHQGSMILMSNGDQPGVMGGIISSMIMGPASPKMGSSKVKIQGQGQVFLTCMFGQNGTNANCPAGMQIAPSQTKVLVAP
jgi:hypothetical protein